MLDGRKAAVLAAADVDEIAVVAARVDDGVGVFLVSRDECTVEPVASMDGSRSLADVVLDGVEVGADRVLGEPSAHAIDARATRGRRGGRRRSRSRSVGTCQSIFDITLDYAKEREQFGVPIGSFQAIKHKFADMLIALERARATGYFAALTIAEDDAAPVDRRVDGEGRRRATAAALFAKEGIQILGGIGYTWEHDMHLYVRRVTADSGMLGTARDHRARIADLLGV